jgi:hypothetical protein
MAAEFYKRNVVVGMVDWYIPKVYFENRKYPIEILS